MNTRLKGFTIIAAVTALVYLMMKYLLPLTLPFVAAFFVVLLIYPLVERIHRKIRLNRAIITGAILLAALLLLGMLIWYLMGRLFLVIRTFYENIDRYIEELRGIVDGCCSTMEELFGIEAAMLKEFIMDSLTRFLEQISENTLPQMMENSISYLIWMTSAFAFFMIVFISIILLSKDFNDIKETHKKYFYYQGLRTFGREAMTMSKNYLKAQLMIMSIISVICITGLLLLRTSYAVVIGIVIGILDAFPVIGTGFIFVPWAIYRLIQGEYLLAAAYITLYVICSMTREFLEPKLVGQKLGIPSIMVLVSVFVGLKLFGLSGILLGPVSYLMIKEITVWLFKSYDISLE